MQPTAERRSQRRALWCTGAVLCVSVGLAGVALVMGPDGHDASGASQVRTVVRAPQGRAGLDLAVRVPLTTVVDRATVAPLVTASTVAESVGVAAATASAPPTTPPPTTAAPPPPTVRPPSPPPAVAPAAPVTPEANPAPATPAPTAAPATAVVTTVAPTTAATTPPTTAAPPTRPPPSPPASGPPATRPPGAPPSSGPPATRPPAPPAQVHIEWGPPGPGWCGNQPCRWVRVSVENLDPPYRYACQSAQGTFWGGITFNRSFGACVGGWAPVWVVVNGVRSNTISL